MHGHEIEKYYIFAQLDLFERNERRVGYKAGFEPKLTCQT